MLHKTMTASQPYIQCGLHLQLPRQEIHLHMLAVSNSETEILNIFINFHSMCKVMDILPLCHKVAYEPCTVVEGQGLLRNAYNSRLSCLQCEWDLSEVFKGDKCLSLGKSFT